MDIEIEIPRAATFKEREQFDPCLLLEEGTVKTYHPACLGGIISFENGDSCSFTCTICGERLEFKSAGRVKAMLRKLLIFRASQVIEEPSAGNRNDFIFREK